jgi:hypothetical protein
MVPERLPLVDQIAVCFGGSEAEKVFGHHTHDLGVSDDLKMIMRLLEDHGILEANGDGLALRNEARSCARTHLEAHRSKSLPWPNSLSSTVAWRLLKFCA